MKNSEIIIAELKIIQNNDEKNKLTHAEVISFCVATIAAIENGHLLSGEFNCDTIDKIIFYLKLISAYGIIHRHRSRIADRCIQFIQETLMQQEDASIF